MIIVSLAVNIVVLMGVTAGFVQGAAWVDRAYGERTPARDILLAVYIAILLASVVLLAGTAWGASAWQRGP